MIKLTPFDPSASFAGSITTGYLPDGSWVLLNNISAVNMNLDFQNSNTALLHSGEYNRFQVDGKSSFIAWSQDSVISGLPIPLSRCTVQVYYPDEECPDNFPTFAEYRVQIGNISGIGTFVDQITDATNSTGHATIQAIPAGVGGPYLIQIHNDGTIVGSVLDNGIYTNSIYVIPGDATHPAVKQFYGNATAADQAITLASGANLPGGTLGESADGDILQLSGSQTFLKNPSSSGAVILLVGTAQALAANSSGLVAPGGRFGKTTAGDIIDGSSTTTFVKGQNRLDIQINGVTVGHFDNTGYHQP